MDKDFEFFLKRDACRNADYTSSRLELMSRSLEASLKKDSEFDPSSPLNCFNRLLRLSKRAPYGEFNLSEEMEETIERGVFDFSKSAYEVFVVDEVRSIFEANLPGESRFDITDGEYDDQLRDVVVSVFGDNCDPKWLELCDRGRRMGILDSLRAFSSGTALGVFTQEELDALAFETQEDFGVSYRLGTKFPEIGVEYYFTESDSKNPVISFVVKDH